MSNHNSPAKIKNSALIAYFAFGSAFWVLLLYWRALNGPFVYDDVSIVLKNSSLTSFFSAFAYFRIAVPYSTDFLGSSGAYYRPLTWLSMGLDRSIWGLHAAGFHFTNLVLHWSNGLLGFVLLRRLRISLPVALATCLVWLALPIDSEVVAWISARSHCLVFFFLLLALLSANWYLQTKRIPALACYFVFCLAALLTHELGILAVALTAIVILASPSRAVRDWAPLFSLAIATDLLYGVMRYLAHGTAPSTLNSIWPVGLSYLKYLAWTVLPVHMSIERSTDTPSAGFSAPAAAALLLVLGFGVLVALVRERFRALWAGVAWWVLALLPVSGLIFLYQGMAERYTYIASAGLVFAIVSLISRIKSLRVRSFAVFIMCAWMLWGAWRLNVRLGDWSSEEKLYESSLIATPQSWILRLNLGNTFLQRGELGPARREYEKTLEVKPDALKAVMNLGAALEMSGDLPAAEQQYRRAVALDPNRSDSYCNLGTVIFEQGQGADAAKLFRKAIELDPSNATAYFDLGVLYARAGHPDAASQMYRQALRINPNYPDASRALALLRNRTK